ncbi:MAG: outer membrane protein assembly factor, partial [Alphaproteobacteria bacterium]|nr:outer membrane protein assembly factor [Alphaproteobacteria bacterium]
ALARARQGTGAAAPETLGTLRRRARSQAELLTRALQSEGFYAARVTPEVTPAEGSARAGITHRVETGRRFTITGHTIRYADTVATARPETLAAADIETSGSAEGTELRRIERALLRHLHATGFPAAASSGFRVEADFEAATARVVYTVESGPRAIYGDLVIEGLERTERRFIRQLRTWETGEPVDLEALDAFRETLAETELFSVITIEPGTPDARGRTPIRLTVAERPPRTVSLGASYSTNVGPGVEASWTHRNVFGAAERLEAELKLAQVLQGAGIGFSRPWNRINGRQGARLTLEREDSEAFMSQRITAAIDATSRLSKWWRARAAVELEASDSDDPVGGGSAYLLAVPLGLTYDSADSVLDPRKGLRATLELTPHGGTSDGEAVSFLKADARAAYYIPFSEEKRTVLAFWAHLGSIAGAELALIPSVRRYYAGGGGSVRAYGYQLIGPLAANDDPTGGRSVAEGGTELRHMFTQTIGAALFVEAGTVTEAEYPDFGEDLLIGGGIGARYLSPVGPIRLDLAVPFDKRDVDDGFQIHISLGQAF